MNVAFPNLNISANYPTFFCHLEINYKLGKIGVLALQTEQLLVFAKEHITKSCAKNHKQLKCQPVSEFIITDFMKCFQMSKIYAGQKKLGSSSFY